ncbi:hypothetical protein G3N56_03640 [Desulfovibrio sulfodismutans]|uniref:Uncharacterized protein n=1 Tax=Desulfolutivibrio sulfodismutans TaxID=63561 RepID=A0A7K3NJ46_9BACT|nr:hypothetical protein [Desulfolutivibrio sulfodismutans]NDY55833.1 hypothetical protein [Desulfolutivibrio sulfodismutans]QLA14236.1 hypothetical protein GD606_19180 [Desulfolutivibrio sulfodismutans DSM 3696]
MDAYIWIINSKHVCYVGQTKKFWNRFVTHFSNTISGLYTCYYPEKGSNFIDFLHQNYAGKDYFDLATNNVNIYLPTANYPAIFPSAIKNTFFDFSSIERRVNFLKSLQFAFASITNGDTIEKIHYKEVESAIICGLKEQYDPTNKLRLSKGLASSGLDRGGYIGRISKYPASSFDIIHINDPANPSIIPPEVFKIVRYVL